jgi:hypothetical protein
MLFLTTAQNKIRPIWSPLFRGKSSTWGGGSSQWEKPYLKTLANAFTYYYFTTHKQCILSQVYTTALL